MNPLRVFCQYLFFILVIILSHGNEGILYGYDRPYPVHKVGRTKFIKYIFGIWSLSELLAKCNILNMKYTVSHLLWSFLLNTEPFIIGLLSNVRPTVLKYLLSLY